ncbi:MAG: NAD-dependent epimerase/dehydratase family protein [Gammaproteobacteria bacterium]|nr:NAD-dependent epimerase/dehydratase family protein [Gammaproteobacteria bacterium]
MKFLVTGATGFVGSVIARQLLKRGDSVRVLARPASDRRNLIGLQVEIIEGDLRQAAELSAACQNVDGLFHVAADYRLWTRDPQALYDSNVAGTVNLMNAALAANVPRIVYTSSVATLGTLPSGSPADEDTPVGLTDMIGHYKRSKYLAELAVMELVATKRLPAIIVNPSTPLGPFDIRPTPTGRIVRDAIRRKIPAYVDTGLNLVHVEDVARGHLLAFEKGTLGRRYILGGEDMSLKEILTAIANLCGHSPPRIKLPRGLIYPIAYLSQGWAWLTNGPEPQATIDGLRMSKKQMFFSSARAVRELGYSARPGRDAIADAVAWFKRPLA